MESQNKEFVELKRYCEIARAISHRSWSVFPNDISIVPKIVENTGSRADINFLRFWNEVNELEAKKGEDIITLERKIINRGHMYLHPSEEIELRTAWSGLPEDILHFFKGEHCTDTFSNRFYAELNYTFNHILNKIFEPRYNAEFKKYQMKRIKQIRKTL